ncbi:MAG: helix-turn-helix domain-containing protein [Clostridia bacterium]|nr:helix-turn-helix domain-containing protein [Clostridia bacterium]
MGNENIYKETRKSLGLSRDDASKLLGVITPERLERIENNKFPIQPDEVCVMADKYKEPSLRNYYCSTQCPIGQQSVPEIKVKNLAEIIIQMIASLNSMKKKQERLIEITSDGRIDNEELNDFIYIQKELERISTTVEALRLWTETMIAEEKIDVEKYNALKELG